jgi:NADPH2 dehydrogenase
MNWVLLNSSKNRFEPTTMSLVNASSRLFAPVVLSSSITLSHRIVLAPLTRYRSTKNDHVPISSLMAEYYGQRASAKGTLLITEATFIAQKAGGYEHIPGIWSEDQVREWKKVSL